MHCEWGSIDDDEVIIALGMQLVETLHRYVVMALNETGRNILVKRVVQDPLAVAGSGACRVTRVSQLCLASSISAHSSPREQPRRPERRCYGRARRHFPGVAQRVSQPPGRVHRDDEHFPPWCRQPWRRPPRRWSSCPPPRPAPPRFLWRREVLRLCRSSPCPSCLCPCSNVQLRSQGRRHLMGRAQTVRAQEHKRDIKNSAPALEWRPTASRRRSR